MADLHRARLAISAVFFVDGAALGGYVAHLSDAKRILNLNDQSLGLVLLASALGAVTTMPFAGPLIHRFGSRDVSLVAGLALCVAVPLLYTAPSVAVFAGLLYFLGASNGQMDVGMNTHSMAIQDRFDRPMLSAVHGWFSIGGFAGGAGAALAYRLGVAPTQHLIIASVLLAVVLLGSQPFLLGADADKGRDGNGLALPHGQLWLIGLLTIFAFVSEGALWDWAAVYIRDSLRSAPWVGPFGFGLASLAMASGRFLGDGWTQRLGRLRLLQISALLSGIGLLVAVISPSIPLSILGFVVAGLGLANVVPLLFRAATQVPGVAAGYGLAAVTTCGYSGFLAGPPAVGLLAKVHSLGFALGVLSLLCFAIAVTASRLSFAESKPELN